MEEKSFLFNARRKSLMTQGDMSSKVGVTVQTILAWEKEPEKVSLENLRSFFNALDKDGKSYFKDNLSSFFLL